MALPFATPASLSPTFVISRCEVADVDALGSVYYDSFKGDRGNSHWWSPNREHMMEWMRSRILKKLADRSVRHFKIIDTEANELVAWARWDIPKDSTHFGDWNGVEAGVADVSSIVKEATEPVAVSSLGQEVSASALATSVDMQPVDIPKGANPEVARNFFNQLAVSATKWHKDDMLGKFPYHMGALVSLTLVLKACHFSAQLLSTTDVVLQRPYWFRCLSLPMRMV